MAHQGSHPALARVTSAPQAMQCDGPACDVSLSGDIDTVTCTEVAETLMRALDGHTGDTLLVDMSAVTFLDSSGLSALVTARNHASARDQKIALTRVPSLVRTVLNITGLSQIFLV